MRVMAELTAQLGIGMQNKTEWQREEVSDELVIFCEIPNVLVSRDLSPQP